MTDGLRCEEATGVRDVLKLHSPVSELDVDSLKAPITTDPIRHPPHQTYTTTPAHVTDNIQSPSGNWRVHCGYLHLMLPLSAVSSSGAAPDKGLGAD